MLISYLLIGSNVHVGAQGTDRTNAYSTEILEDELSIRIRNVKPEFLALFFERRQLIRFGSHEDLLRYTRFTLPESLDPPYDRSFFPWQDREAPARPRWLNVRMDHFSAHIIHADGTKGELPVITSVEFDELRTFRTMERAESFIHDVQALEVGDVLEVHWKYMIPYDHNLPATHGWRGFEWMDNWARLTSWRVFFNGSLPIRRQSVELLFDSRHGMVLGGTAPTERSTNGKEIRCRWEHVDLPGSIDEPNARPAEDLPHITVLFAPQDFRYWRRDRLSGIPFEQPYWMEVVRYREARAFWWLRVSRKRIPDKQNQLVKEFINRTSGHLPDSLRAKKLELVHERIAQDFEYENDDLWYRDRKGSVHKIGDQLKNDRIRDISRYDMYSKLANALRLHYSTAYVMDRRVGSMTDRYLSPLWDSEFLMGVRDHHGFTWMHPKRTRHGLMANELPFYWQGTSALLVDLELLLDDLPPPPLFVELPQGSDMENVRGKEFSVSIDLQEHTSETGIRVYLSGQFSTLGRGAYLGFPIDSTINPLYGHRAFDIADASVVIWNNSIVDQDRPFRFRADGRALLGERMIQTNEDHYSIELTGLFSNVLPPPFDPEQRHVPFHWDFPQVDHHTVEIRFDRAIEILDRSGIEMEIATSASSFYRKVRVLAPDRIVVETKLQVTREREDPAEMQQLAGLVRSAQEKVILKVRPVELAGPEHIMDNPLNR